MTPSAMDSPPVSPTQKPASVLGEKAARWLMVTFGAGLIAVTGLAILDRGRVAQLETFSSGSAVGDRAYFKLPPGLIPSEPVATLDGKALYVTSREKKKIDDAEMIRAGFDETTALTIYTPQNSGDAGKRELFLKIDLGEYIPVSPRQP